MPDISDPDTLVRSAQTMLAAGEVRCARAHCLEALRIDATHRGARILLGHTLYRLERYAEADEAFAEATRLEPTDPAAWINLGTARRSTGRLDAALVAYARAAELGAASADFYYNVGLTHIDRRDYEAARAVLACARRLTPYDAEVAFQYAQSCYEVMRAEEAARTLEDWPRLVGLTPELVANIAYLLMNLGESQRAQDALDAAMAQTRNEPDALLTLAQIHERINKLDEARELVDRITADPRAVTLGDRFILVRAQLAQRASQYQSARQLLEKALGQCPHFHLRHFQLFPLAKSLDGLGRHDEAFAIANEAHHSQAAYIKMTSPATSLRGPPTLAITQFRCDPADVEGWRDSAPPGAMDSPIFIVAFPRSGTTLLELTLDSHPLLVSMDEQPYVQNALDDLVALGFDYPTGLARLTQTQLEGIRARYWKRVGNRVRLGPGQRLLDKNPLNILRLPVIRRLFPNAQIILAIRHPCDVLLSCFMQHFRAADFALLCGTLPKLAAGFRRTLDFWYDQALILRPCVWEVRYESLVADFAAQILELTEFLELPWNDTLLAPAEHARKKGFISTPSYAQVAQPVHRESVDKWRHYKPYLSQVLAPLRPYFERWAYDA